MKLPTSVCLGSIAEIEYCTVSEQKRSHVEPYSTRCVCVQYLYFLHLPLHGNPVQSLRAGCHCSEVLLGWSKPIREGHAEFLCLLDAPKLLLQLLDGLLKADWIKEWVTSDSLHHPRTMKIFLFLIPSTDVFFMSWIWMWLFYGSKWCYWHIIHLTISQFWGGFWHIHLT